MKYIFVIPAYNPDEELLKVIKNIGKYYDIILVDDGNKDKTIFKNMPSNVKLISYNTNKGKGYALKEAYKYIKENYKEYVVVSVDADNQHDISDALKLCDYVKENKDTLAIGKRTRNNNTPLRSRFGNSVTKKVFKLKTGLDIYDTQSGLRAFSNELMDFMLSVKGSRYEYEMNTLLSLKKNNIKYKEIDIKTIYYDNNKKSNFKALKDSYIIYKDIIKWKNK